MVKLFSRLKSTNPLAIVLCFTLIFGMWGIVGMENDRLQSQRIADLEARVEKLQELSIILANCQDIAKDRVDEMEVQEQTEEEESRHLWEAIAMMNNNFKALGLGFHLEVEDICPEAFCEEEWAGRETPEYLDY